MMTKLAVLEQIKTTMSDPDRVVKDPRNIYEDEGGRACLLGWASSVCGGIGAEPNMREIGRAVNEAMLDAARELGFTQSIDNSGHTIGWDPCTMALEDGKHIEVLDKAIENVKAQELVAV